MAKQRTRTVAQRIVDADRRGVGLRLSPSEVHELAADDAISSLALNDDDPEATPDAR